MLKADRPSRKKEKLLRALQDDGPKKRMNVDVEAELYRRMRARALEEDQTISAITRRLWLQYLEQQ